MALSSRPRLVSFRWSILFAAGSPIVPFRAFRGPHRVPVRFRPSFECSFASFRPADCLSVTASLAGYTTPPPLPLLSSTAPHPRSSTVRPTTSRVKRSDQRVHRMVNAGFVCTDGIGSSDISRISPAVSVRGAILHNVGFAIGMGRRMRAGRPQGGRWRRRRRELQGSADAGVDGNGD
ncbi:hypothetical protein R3P38DRAFT_1511750 [Favolaschia claudopus]|uniref:Uncharacterized protein n=1 Tax=Favolaschia claudopus TaxID=2862362 RepID=A0AAW0AJH5_9AGAR